MFCPSCGRQSDDSAAFCPDCGNDLNAARAAAEADSQGAEVPTPSYEPHLPTAPMSIAETAPMAAAADSAAQAEYQAEMARYERDMAAWQAQYGTPPGVPAGTAPGAPAKKSRAGLIIGIILGLLLLCSCTSCGIWFAAAPVIYKSWSQATGATTLGQPDSNDVQTTEDSIGSSTESSSATPTGPTNPEAAVDAWYLAVSSGELPTVKSLATPDFAAAIDPGMFEGRDPSTNYRILGTSIKGDRATVNVAESTGDAPAQTAMAFTLARQPDGTWLVAGFEASVIGGATKTNPEPPPAAPRTVTKSDAIDVVGRYLNAEKSGHNAEMKTYVTKRFLKADPGRFVGSAKEAFIRFEVVKAVKKGDTWLVYTKESWISGPETPTYYVVLQNGKALINNETWPK